MFFSHIEAPVVLLTVIVAFLFPRLGERWFPALERRFITLAERRSLAVALTGLLALATRAALLPILPIPDPAIHDEFGYLLLADTFAHGRLTNPTNPMWVHFESFHIIWQPTYTAMFYPAQGLFMALGQVLMGHPFWGVWLSIGLMCAAITWMLQGWLPAGWALLGGCLAVIRIGACSYWANSYWGGAVAALGGALALGALPRIKRSLRVRDAVLLGIGLAIIANSRPYEGLFFGISIGAALLYWMLRKRGTELRVSIRRVAVPLLLVLVLAGAGMDYYFWRTTGSLWNTPYLIDIRTYNPVPYFPWQSVGPTPAYHHAVFQAFYLGPGLACYRVSRTIVGFVKLELTGLLQTWGFYLGIVFTLPLLMMAASLPYGFAWKNISRDTRFLLLICGAVVFATMLPIYAPTPHYSAPITCAMLALVLIAMRRIRHWEWKGGKPAGLFVTRAVPSICLLLLVLRTEAGPLHLPQPSQWPGSGVPTWCSVGPANHDRAAMLQELKQHPGRQLVIVHYNPDHEIAFHEWVYNRADINSAKVIWARDMGPAKNQEIIGYFKDRRAWLVEADDNPPRLLPYASLQDEASGSPVRGTQ